MKTMTRRMPLALAGALLLAAVAAPAQEKAKPAPAPEKVPAMELPAQSPDLAATRVQTLGGRGATLAELTAGKPALLVFWATWCPDCRKETPAVKALWARYRDRGLKVVAVSTGGRDTVAMVRKYLDENGVTYPVFYDADKSASKAFGIAWIPTFFLLDGRGQVVYKAATPPPAATVEALLAGQPLPE